MQRRDGGPRSGFTTFGVILVIWLLSGFAVTMATGLGPAWSAAHGRGKTGTFIVTSHTCSTSRGHTSCDWHGSFVSADGTDVRTDVQMTGGLGDGAAIGRTYPALDSGDHDNVFVPHGSWAWVNYLGGLLLAGAALAAILWGIGRTLLRAILTRRSQLGPAYAGRGFSAALITATVALAILTGLNMILAAHHASGAVYAFANLGAALTGLVAVSLAAEPREKVDPGVIRTTRRRDCN